MASPRIAILLPPSASKAAGGDEPPWTWGACALPGLDDARAEVLAALAADGHDLRGEPTTAAIARYTGVLYRELDWPSLPAAARTRGRRSLLTFSGLWGAVAPDDPIPHYRLPMSASVPRLGRLATWWRPRLTAALVPRLKGVTVWDLLPGDHAAAWQPAEVPYRRRHTVHFVDAGGRRVAHWNKLLKGSLVRHLLVDPTADPDDLGHWQHPAGYRYDRQASDLASDPSVVVFREGFSRRRGSSARRPR